MPINKGKIFSERDVYIDYSFERVMYRWDVSSREVYVKFYGKNEQASPIPYGNRLFNDSLLFGEEITREEYLLGEKFE